MLFFFFVCFFYSLGVVVVVVVVLFFVVVGSKNMHLFYKSCCNKHGVIFGNGVENEHAGAGNSAGQSMQVFPSQSDIRVDVGSAKILPSNLLRFKQSGHEKDETLEQNHRKQNSR